MVTTAAPRKVTLSFDNGPTQGVTDQVLDLLADRGLLALFFPIAQKLAEPSARAVMERAVREGHRVGNHSLTHGAPLGDISASEATVEIGKAQEILADLADPARWIRPWGTDGELNQRCLSPAAVEYLVAGGYTCVLWNSVPHDWEDPSGWVDVALLDVRGRGHTLIVLHDLPTGAMDELPRFLDELRNANVTITQDLPASCLPIVNGELVASVRHLVAGGGWQAGSP